MRARGVVDFDAGVGYGNRGDKDADCYPDMCAERSIGMARGPVHLHIDHGVVGDIERIGDEAEKFAEGSGFASFERTACACGHDERIDYQNCQCAIKAVEPLMGFSADVWNYKSGGDGK